MHSTEDWSTLVKLLEEKRDSVLMPRGYFNLEGGCTIYIRWGTCPKQHHPVAIISNVESDPQGAGLFKRMIVRLEQELADLVYRELRFATIQNINLLNMLKRNNYMVKHCGTAPDIWDGEASKPLEPCYAIS